MKRIISFALIFIMALSLAACRQPKEASVDPTDAPKPTETVTQPTEEPTPAPTEAPTPEPTEAPLPDDPDAIGDCFKDAEIILRIPYGDGEKGAGLEGPDSFGRDWYNGPESFAVEDGTVYILDTAKCRVIVWDGEGFSYIPFSDAPDCGHCSEMAVADDKIYIGNTEEEESIITVYDMTGNKLGNIPMPEDAAESGLNELFNADGRIFMSSNDLVFYELVDGEFVRAYEIDVDHAGEGRYSVVYGDLELVIESGSNTMIGVRRIIGDRVYCKVFEFDPASTAIQTETSYRVYGADGDLIGMTVVDRDSVFALPGSEMFITSDGTLYVMCLMQDGVYITRPNLRLEYTSHLGK
ncbi:MAG: hypothetical protein J5586_05700 [Clostridia bacterium]|nr:hypothetical protein [Clostridia bacterium]